MAGRTRLLRAGAVLKLRAGVAALAVMCVCVQHAETASVAFTSPFSLEQRYFIKVRLECWRCGQAGSEIVVGEMTCVGHFIDFTEGVLIG